MKQIITFEIDRNDLGQIADALEVRLSQWRDTESFFRNPESDVDDLIEEAADIEEATDMVNEYERILKVVWKHLQFRKV